MKKEIEIIPFEEEKGVQFKWESGFVIETVYEENQIVIKANVEGLVSLARHMLTLAQSNVKVGVHIHLDEFNSLEDNSVDLVIEKIS